MSLADLQRPRPTAGGYMDRDCWTKARIHTGAFIDVAPWACTLDQYMTVRLVRDALRSDEQWFGRWHLIEPKRPDYAGIRYYVPRHDL